MYTCENNFRNLVVPQQYHILANSFYLLERKTEKRRYILSWQQIWAQLHTFSGKKEILKTIGRVYGIVLELAGSGKTICPIEPWFNCLTTTTYCFLIPTKNYYLTYPSTKSTPSGSSFIGLSKSNSEKSSGSVL